MCSTLFVLGNTLVIRFALTTDLNLEQSLTVQEAIAALHRLYPETAATGSAEDYFRGRGSVIDELMAGRVSFQVGPNNVPAAWPS